MTDEQIKIAKESTDMTDEQIKIAVEVWKKTIDVQQHFNDIEMRIRNFAVTMLAAVIGAAGVALKDPAPTASIFSIDIRLAAWILFAGLIAWLAFYFMDRWWYHRLLQGAVKHAQSIENQMRDIVPSLNLSNSIRKASPIPLSKKYSLRSDIRIDLFYGVVSALIFALAYFVG